MRIYELVEGIGTIGSSSTEVGTIPTTGNRPIDKKTSNQTQAQTTSTAYQSNQGQTTQLQTSLNQIKPAVKAAGGGDLNVPAVGKMLSNPDPTKIISPMDTQKLQSMLPGIANALQNPQSANMLKQAIKTGVDAKAKAAQTPPKDQQIGQPPVK